MTFLNVESFGLKPAEFTPRNLNDLTNVFLLFRFPLLCCFIFLIFILTSFLKNVCFDSFSLNFGFETEASGSPEPSEKPTVLFHYSCFPVHLHHQKQHYG